MLCRLFLRLQEVEFLPSAHSSLWSFPPTPLATCSNDAECSNVFTQVGTSAAFVHEDLWIGT